MPVAKHGDGKPCANDHQRGGTLQGSRSGVGKVRQALQRGAPRTAIRTGKRVFGHEHGPGRCGNALGSVKCRAVQCRAAQEQRACTPAVCNGLGAVVQEGAHRRRQGGGDCTRGVHGGWCIAHSPGQVVRHHQRGNATARDVVGGGCGGHAGMHVVRHRLRVGRHQHHLYYDPCAITVRTTGLPWTRSVPAPRRRLPAGGRRA